MTHPTPTQRGTAIMGDEKRTKTWLPQIYMDEVIPAPRRSPNDWIVQLPGDGVYALAPAEDDEQPTRILNNGDRLQFDWMEDHGRAEFTVVGGKWSVDRQPPPEVTHICEIGNPDSLSYEGIEVFARQWIEVEADDIETTLFYYTWSEQPETFEFQNGAFVALKAKDSTDGDDKMELAELRQAIVMREARRREILEWLEEEIGTAWECEYCQYSSYHQTNNECANCGTPFPRENLLAFKLHAAATENQELLDAVAEDIYGVKYAALLSAPATPSEGLVELPFQTLADELRRRGATVTPAPHAGDFSDDY